MGVTIGCFRVVQDFVVRVTTIKFQCGVSVTIRLQGWVDCWVSRFTFWKWLIEGLV